MKTTIIVTPIGENGFCVTINGEQHAKFADGGLACAAWAEKVLRVRELESIIEKHAASLRAMLPEHTEKIDAVCVQNSLQIMASRLKTLAGLDNPWGG